MSFQAMTWATAQNCGSPTTKLVLLMLANHANGHTGQCNPRHRTLAAECEIRVETLKEHLKRLADAGLIEIIPQFAEGVQLPNRYRLNMVGGGGEIHPVGGGEIHPVGGGEIRTGGRGEIRPPNNQEDNQEDNRPLPPKGESLPSGFAEFWVLYPKKVGKDAALSAWKRKVKGDHMEVIDALKTQKTQEAWTKEGGRFVPNPATWLNQGRWKDEAGQGGECSAAADWTRGAV